MKYALLFLAVFVLSVVTLNFWQRLPVQSRPLIFKRLVWILIPTFIAGASVLAVIFLASNGASVRLI